MVYPPGVFEIVDPIAKWRNCHPPVDVIPVLIVKIPKLSGKEIVLCTWNPGHVFWNQVIEFFRQHAVISLISVTR